MPATLAAGLALGVTCLCLTALLLSDEKRHRDEGNAMLPLQGPLRGWVAVASLLPGVCLMLAAYVAPFLIWLGGGLMFGWFLSRLPARY